MSWFNKKKKEDELDMPSLPELPDISEFNLPSQLPEVPPGLSNEKLPPFPPIQPISSDFRKSEPALSLPPIQPPSLPPIRPVITKQMQTKPVPEMRTSLKPMVSTGFTPSRYQIQAEPEGLGIKEIGGISPMTMEMETPQFEQPQPAQRRIEPLYIRLDKFETTINSIREIQHKVREIEGLLVKTKEIKEREEQELEEWEKEIQGIKSRMDFIDKNVFNKLG